MPEVQTVRGPIDAAALGRVLAHEDVFLLNPELAANHPEAWGCEEERIADAVVRLRALKQRGIDTIADPTVLGLGRLKSSRAFARRTDTPRGLHIPASRWARSPSGWPHTPHRLGRWAPRSQCQPDGGFSESGGTDMRGRVVGAAMASVAVAGGLVVSSLGGTAVAGHTNKLLSAKLDGKQEVPKKGDPDGSGSVFVFGIDGDPKTLCYVLKVGNIKLEATGMAAHIHEGAKGKAGDVVVNLAGPFDGDAADCLTEGETLASGAKAFPGKVKVKDILAKPGDFYVNVHNTEYSGGALRGQLKAD